VYQSLPRLLSIWFDFAAGVQSGDYSNILKPSYSSSSSSSNDSSVGSRTEAVLEIMNTAISEF